ncbi:DsbA family oxidoreductase [Albidovulum sediminis]|uniref:DsbA family oxidoreductase n=1 Tax=Albidovulum sediminis TaxID=3066345 RepID=A0ABT2NMR7_9RHOB|nr:DsbA family oxidoreductase [Defluviimonas sediminis]MCT8328849.1 DsbA family oxidoreductase [Defluviimonas sediminis]
MIKLDILSDPICPWCYIGKARLDRALEARPDHPFEIEWHPFQLNPEMPREGVERRTYMEAKFGGKEGAVRAYRPVVDHAEDAGLELNLDRIERTPNTLDAHRLIHWAGLEGRQTAVVSGLFRAYFREGCDIGDAGVLADLAGEAGLDREMVARLLAGDGDRAEIAARDAHARERGVSAVPTFVLANTYVLSGAQPTETWLKIIDELVSQKKENTA